MKPIAAPIIGGMATSTIHVLIITPIIFLHRGAARPASWHVEGVGDGAVMIR